MSNIMTHCVILKTPLSKCRRILGQVPNTASKKNDIFHAKLGTFKDPSCYFSHLSLIGELTWERLATGAASSQEENTSWSLFQAPPMFSRCCRKHAREIKHFLKSKAQGTSYTMSFSFFIHSENYLGQKICPQT